MRRIKSLCLALVFVFAFTGCVWAATNGILTAIDSSGKVLGERFSVPEDAAVEFVVSWDAAVAENIDCIFFVRSNDNYCVSGPCWSADQSPDYGWHHGGGNGGGHGGHHGSGHGDAWHHRQHVSHDVFCPASGDHCIIAKGYGNVDFSKFFWVGTGPNVPDEVVDALADVIEKACADPDFVKTMEGYFLNVRFMKGKEAQDFCNAMYTDTLLPYKDEFLAQQ